MNRRDFITAIFGAAAAALVLPHVERVAPLLEGPEPFTSPAWEPTFREILIEASRLYREAMIARGFPPIAPAHCANHVFGDTIDGAIMKDQFSVEADSSHSIPAAMAVLADRAALAGLDRYGRLRLPLAGTEYAGLSGPLRMVVGYRIETDSILTRFDVIGGSTPDGLRRSRAHIVQILKSRIRRRVATEYRLKALPA